jgi:hypothetical protein
MSWAVDDSIELVLSEFGYREVMVFLAAELMPSRLEAGTSHGLRAA